MTLLKAIDGLPVLDAKRPLKLSITKGDIARAATSIKEPKGCAVARACMRELHVKEARVHLSRIYLRTNDSNWVRYLTPKELRSEIIAFDRGGSFQPCEVRLTPVPPSKQQRSHQGSDEPAGARSKRPNTKPRAYHRIENVRAGPA